MSTSASTPLTLEILKDAIANNAAALRCRRILQPEAGPGGKVFPPTFAGAVYAVEKRRVPGREEPVTCVVLDTVQSQANRMEAALQEALDGGRLTLPVITVDFSEHAPTGDLEDDANKGRLLDDVGVITSLQVPHRLADAILRDSVSKKDGVPFRKTDAGKLLNKASNQNATALYRYCPTALVFGMWDSTGPKGGLGAKFERAMVSEFVGIDAVIGDLIRGVRRDPLEARSNIQVKREADKSWSVLGVDVKGGVNPSKVNHSSVPFPEQKVDKTEKNRWSGVTIEKAEQLTTLSLIALRRLRFPVDGAKDQAAVNNAAQTVLAALGLCAATLAFENGMGLRSRCTFWPDAAMSWEILARPGETPESYAIDGVSAIELFTKAVEEAEAQGLVWETKPVELKPSANLLELVRLSQQQAVKSDSED